MLKKSIAVMLFAAGGFVLSAQAATHKTTHHNSVHAAVAGRKFDINAATLKQWVAIKGIGQKRAAAIVAYRKQHGKFASVSDLEKIRGISAASIERLEKKNSVKFMVVAA